MSRASSSWMKLGGVSKRKSRLGGAVRERVEWSGVEARVVSCVFFLLYLVMFSSQLAHPKVETRSPRFPRVALECTEWCLF